MQEVVFEQNFDSNTTARALNHIIKNKRLSIEKFLSNYDTEIIKNRNKLAHCKSELKENGIEVLETVEKDKEYSSSETNELRKNILKYREIFEELLEKIRNN